MNAGRSRLALMSALLFSAGCASGVRDDGRRAPRDAGSGDSGIQVDAAMPSDGGVRLDAGTVDGGSLDAGGRMDASVPDAGLPDAGFDAGMADAGIDAGMPDAGIDAGMPDAGTGGACMDALGMTRNGFESTADGWLTGNLDGVTGSWPYNPWEWGTPRSGQPACSEGTTCLGTDMDDNYAQCGRGFIESPAFDVSACGMTPLVLVMSHHYSFWTGSYGGSTWTDGGVVEVSADGGSTWMALDAGAYPGTVRINPNRGSGYSCLSAGSFYVDGRPGFVGTGGGWENVRLPLPAAAWGASSLKVRFLYSSGVSSRTTNANTSRGSTDSGWFMDDVRIEAM